MPPRRLHRWRAAADTTITGFADDVDITISELKLEAFLPQANSAALIREAERP
jgi:hypothetical protein